MPYLVALKVSLIIAVGLENWWRAMWSIYL